jgi:hypothetical protein
MLCNTTAHHKIQVATCPLRYQHEMLVRLLSTPATALLPRTGPLRPRDAQRKYAHLTTLNDWRSLRVQAAVLVSRAASWWCSSRPSRSLAGLKKWDSASLKLPIASEKGRVKARGPWPKHHDRPDAWGENGDNRQQTLGVATVPSRFWQLSKAFPYEKATTGLLVVTRPGVEPSSLLAQQSPNATSLGALHWAWYDEENSAWW